MTIVAGKIVLITGASRGIGVSIAHKLAKKKAIVVAVSRCQEKLDRVCTEINALGGETIGISFDLSQVEQLPTLVEEVKRQAGSVDILINNAGIEIYKAFPDYSLADLQSVLSINLLAAMELTRLILPDMLLQRRGHIVNITSLAAKKGHPYDSVYSASKAGLLMWNNALRQELWDTGVAVSSICPGYISDRGLLADSGVSAPQWAGVSKAQDVANGVVRAIEQNRAEIVVNRGPLPSFSTLTKLLLAMEQLFPGFPDITNRWLGVPRINRQRIEPPAESKPLVHH